MSSHGERDVDADVDAEGRRLLRDLAQIRTSKTESEPKIPFKRQIVWKNVAVFVIGHLLALYGFYIWMFQTSLRDNIAATIFGYYISIQGVQMGAHRYYSHRCFKASIPMQVLMVLAQTTASQNCMWVWVRDHRQHHKYADTDADPHNAKNGFFFCHVGWLLSKKHPEVIEKGKTIDMSDLDADPIVMFQKRHYKKLWVLCAILLPLAFPVFVLGQPLYKAFLLWVVVRTVLSLHLTWLVNSWAHLYGTKPFDKDIMPVESYFVGIVGVGEGWHNYHHTFAWDYKASELGAPFNLTARYIEFLASLGAVWDLKQASDEMIVARASRTGDGTPIRTELNGLEKTTQANVSITQKVQ